MGHPSSPTQLCKNSLEGTSSRIAANRDEGRAGGVDINGSHNSNFGLMNSHFETTDNLGRRAAYGLDYAIGYFLSVFETNADGEEMEVVALATGFGDNRGVILDKIIELQVGE